MTLLSIKKGKFHCDDPCDTSGPDNISMCGGGREDWSWTLKPNWWRLLVVLPLKAFSDPSPMPIPLRGPEDCSRQEGEELSIAVSFMDASPPGDQRGGEPDDALSG
ncbi:hypothetical protein EYF80_064104 [Liparis tanakae]|uniref:Uncharacterized protein n=1 Tax=Liparis tanakae TaxID=230148 RepID=A0A4Z2EAI3_9TELE|nr:hypothetical protein EYF80_064104 [Liparis tanakae]